MINDQTNIEALPHKAALVTGGAGGIGLAIAKMLISHKVRTVIADVHEVSVDEENLVYHWTDISKSASITELYSFLQRENLLPDLIVCNAGRGIQERLAEGDPEKWFKIINLNVMGHLRTIRAFLPQMLQKDTATDIVFISSVAARKPHEWGGIYAASKAALQSIAETLRLEVQPKIRVGSVLPGVVDTHFFDNMIGGGQQSPNGFGWGSLNPHEVATAVHYMISRPPEVAVNELTIRPAAQAF